MTSVPHSSCLRTIQECVRRLRGQQHLLTLVPCLHLRVATHRIGTMHAHEVRAGTSALQARGTCVCACVSTVMCVPCRSATLFVKPSHPGSTANPSLPPFEAHGSGPVPVPAMHAKRCLKSQRTACADLLVCVVHQCVCARSSRAYHANVLRLAVEVENGVLAYGCSAVIALEEAKLHGRTQTNLGAKNARRVRARNEPKQHTKDKLGEDSRFWNRRDM